MIVHLLWEARHSEGDADVIAAFSDLDKAKEAWQAKRDENRLFTDHWVQDIEVDARPDASLNVREVLVGTIRERVIAYLERQPERTEWAAEVFDQIGCRSWPTFCREVHRMESTDDLVLDTDEFECTSISLPEDQEQA